MPRYAHREPDKKPVRDTHETPAPNPDGDRADQDCDATSTSKQKPQREDMPEDDPAEDRDAAGEKR